MSDNKILRVPFGEPFTDPETKREIIPLTNPDTFETAGIGYFRLMKNVPGGMMGYCRLNGQNGKHGKRALINMQEECVEVLPLRLWPLKISPNGTAWCLDGKRKPTSLHSLQLPYGEPVFVADIPADLPGEVVDITIDGKKLILADVVDDVKTYPPPTQRDVGIMERYFRRERRGAIWVYDIKTGQSAKLYEVDSGKPDTNDPLELLTWYKRPGHIQTSFLTPEHVVFACDAPEAYHQRAWIMDIDGSGLKRIPRQEPGEMVTHEFWLWHADLMGYTYQNIDRPDASYWGEYNEAETQLGIADLEGNVVFMSDPLNAFHQHLGISADGRFFFGEGGPHFPYVCAAPFSIEGTGNLTPLATIHGDWVPFRGRYGVAADVLDDWLIFSDGRSSDRRAPTQLYAVRIDE